MYDRTDSPSVWHEVEYARRLIGIMESNYPETLARALLFPTSGSFRWGWKVAQVLVDDDTRSKLVLTGGSRNGEEVALALAKYIDPTILGTRHLAGR